MLPIACDLAAERLQPEDRSGTAGRVVYGLSGRSSCHSCLVRLSPATWHARASQSDESTSQTHPALVSETTTTLRPSGVNNAAAFRPATGPGNGSPIVDRVRTSHSRTSPAASAPTAVLPSGARSTVSTKPLRPVSGPPRGFLVTRSHRRTAPVWTPVMRVRPSVEGLAVKTPAASAYTVFTIRCAAVSHRA
jgi:hypothetical protein